MTKALTGPTNPSIDDTQDTLTILTHHTRSLRLAKLWKKDGTIEGYEKPKRFNVEELPCANLKQFATLLMNDLMNDPYRCIIKGKLREEFKDKGVVFRDLEHFEPQRSHLFMIDVDHFEPLLNNPVTEPAEAAQEYIESALPPEFQQSSYVWKLSGSMGKTPGLLKCHLYFWLKQAYYPEELSTWVRVNGLQMDTAVLRTVQALYTANPVFERGVKDPFKQRAGYVRKTKRNVSLTLSEEALQQARVFMDAQVDLVDPTKKPGLIGAFCRTYSIEEVIEKFLPHVFEFQEGSDRRLNFLLSDSGVAGGAWISDCRQYVCNSHNSDPLGNRLTNKWDLVRHYVHGGADADLDAFELLDVSSRPSQRALAQALEAVPEVMAEFVRAAQAQLLDLTAQIENAASDYELKTKVASAIRRSELSEIDIGQVVGKFQLKFRMLTGVKPTKAEVMSLINPPQEVSQADPGEYPWCADYYFLTASDKFYNYLNGEELSKTGFNAKFNRRLGRPDVNAADWVLQEDLVQTVCDVSYVPYFGKKFSLDELEFVNGYKPATVPRAFEMRGGERAVTVFKQHIELLFGGRKKLAKRFIQFLAHNVQNPGVKVIHAWLIKGCMGDGKTVIRSVMAAVMGNPQVQDISSDALHSNFSSYVVGAAFRVFEELRSSGQNRHAVMEKLKTPITNDRVTVLPKGRDEFNAINTQNYLAFTNHVDALPLPEGDRRWVVVFSPFQSLSQIQEAVGDLKVYFDRLHDTYRKFGPHMRHWLLSVDLSDYDPREVAMSTPEKKEMIFISEPEGQSQTKDLTKDLLCISTKWLREKANLDDISMGKKDTPKQLSKLGYSLWYPQFKVGNLNTTVYGLGSKKWTPKEVRDYFSETGQDQNPTPF